jgi:hypothetical protein
MNVGFRSEKKSDELLTLLKSMNKKIVKEKMEQYGIEDEPSEEIIRTSEENGKKMSNNIPSLKSFAVYKTQNKIVNCFKQKLRRKLEVKE